MSTTLSPANLVLLLGSLAASVHAQAGGPAGNDAAAPAPSNALELAHAITAALAWVFFFPLGAILLRIINGSTSVWVHASIQSFTVLLVVASVVTGVYLARQNQNLDTYHPIIGLCLFGLVVFQWIGGVIHHLLFRKYSRRTIVSHVHMWLGRVLITFGMINGGLGMLLAADSTKSEQIAYGVVAGVIWLIFVAVSVWSATTRSPTTRKSGKSELEK